MAKKINDLDDSSIRPRLVALRCVLCIRYFYTYLYFIITLCSAVYLCITRRYVSMVLVL